MTRNMRDFIALALLFFIQIPLQALEKPAAKRSIAIQELKQHFADPDKLYAPSVFWFWDRPLNDESKVRVENMARTMIEQGLNPGYVHARFNMVGEPDLPFSQWLSDDWFAAFGLALARAEQAHAYIGYVDEYWWPSGRAAGRILEKNRDLWAESLMWQTIDVAGGTQVEIGESFFVVAARLAQENREGRWDGGNARWKKTGWEFTDELEGAGCSSGQNQAENILGYLQQQRQVKKALAEKDSLELVPHVPAVIHSASLLIVGEGEPFRWCAPDDGIWRIYIFNKYFHPGCDGGRLNYLDERLSQLFLKEAHEPYAARFKDHLGERITGVFVDHEGDYGYKLAWSRDMAEYYEQKTGRDIRLWMPLLFEKDVEGLFVKARWDWFDAVSDIYVEFFRGTNQWCLDHGMYAISNLWEESLMWQASAVGDFFKAQRAFSLPGTDALGLRVLLPHDFMETKSVCEFEGRRFQSEMMGGSGFWGFNNITIKQAANAAIAWGVSHIVPHAVWLTRKLDGNPWLPDWYEQNPWWPQMHLWSDFVRRACYINSHGHVAADVLLLNPMDSVWGRCGPGVFDPAFKGRVPGPAVQPLQSETDIFQTPQEVKEQSAWWCPPVMDAWYEKKVHVIDRIYSDVINDLVNQRIEFLIADRHYMRQMHVKGDELVRPPFHFKRIILPGIEIVPRYVMRKIVDFAKNGGAVHVIGSWPAGSMEAGLIDPEIDLLVQKLKNQANVAFYDSSLGSLTNQKPAFLRSHLEFIDGEFEMRQQHRRIDNRDLFWLANNSGRTQQCRLRYDKRVDFEKWNCETGCIEPVTFEHESDGVILDLRFDPYEAFWLVTSNQALSMPVEWDDASDTLYIKNPWHVHIDPKKQPPLEYEIKISGKLDEGAFYKLADWNDWGLGDFSGIVCYQNSFKLPKNHGMTILDLGNVHVAARVHINGSFVGDRLWPPYQFDITPYVQPGGNALRITVGNLLNNSYGDFRPSGLLGVVKIICRSR